MTESGFIGSSLRARCEVCPGEMWEGENSLADARRHQRRTGHATSGERTMEYRYGWPDSGALP